jgi:hypothetical protein
VLPTLKLYGGWPCTLGATVFVEVTHILWQLHMVPSNLFLCILLFSQHLHVKHILSIFLSQHFAFKDKCWIFHFSFIVVLALPVGNSLVRVQQPKRVVRSWVRTLHEDQSAYANF